MYGARGICKQILMDLNIPLQDAVLSFPMPRTSQQAGAPFLGTVTLNSASQGLFPPKDTQIAPKDRHLLSTKRAVCWEGVLECSITVQLSLDIVTAISFSRYLLR